MDAERVEQIRARLDAATQGSWEADLDQFGETRGIWPTGPEPAMTAPSPYSDAALAKQAEWDRIEAAGGEPPLTLLYGIGEPRVQPTAGERCRCCGIDARPEWGGNGTHCSVCIGRGHDDRH